MRIGEAARYMDMSVVGVRKAAEQGRLACRRSQSGQRLFDRADLDAFLGRPVLSVAASSQERVEALYCRVSGSTGEDASLAVQERLLRESAKGRVFRVYRDN